MKSVKVENPKAIFVILATSIVVIISTIMAIISVPGVSEHIDEIINAYIGIGAVMVSVGIYLVYKDIQKNEDKQ